MPPPREPAAGQAAIARQCARPLLRAFARTSSGATRLPMFSNNHEQVRYRSHNPASIDQIKLKDDLSNMGAVRTKYDRRENLPNCNGVTDAKYRSVRFIPPSGRINARIFACNRARRRNSQHAFMAEITALAPSTAGGLVAVASRNIVGGARLQVSDRRQSAIPDSTHVEYRYEHRIRPAASA